jgi:hypothetical protein
LRVRQSRIGLRLRGGELDGHANCIGNDVPGPDVCILDDNLFVRTIQEVVDRPGDIRQRFRKFVGNGSMRIPVIVKPVDVGILFANVVVEELVKVLFVNLASRVRISGVKPSGVERSGSFGVALGWVVPEVFRKRDPILHPQTRLTQLLDVFIGQWFVANTGEE